MKNRIQRINQLLKEELGKILLREADFSEVLATVTRVETASNVQEAKVFVSVMPENKTDEVFNFLNRNIYNIQQELNKRLLMRPVPKIIFKKEGKTKEAARIEELLVKALGKVGESLKKP